MVFDKHGTLERALAIDFEISDFVITPRRSWHVILNAHPLQLVFLLFGCIEIARVAEDAFEQIEIAD